MATTPKPTVEDSYAAGLTCAICGEPALYVQHLPNYPDFVTCRNCESAFVVEDSGERVMYGKIPDAYPETQTFALRQWVWLEAVDRRARQENPRAVPAPPPNLPEEPRDQLAREAAPPEEKVPETPEPDADWLAARLKSSDMPAGVPIPTEPEPYRASGVVPLASDTSPQDDSLPAWLRDEAAPQPPAPPAQRPAPQPVIPERPKITPGPVAPTTSPAAAAPEEPPAREGEPPPDRRHRVIIRGDRLRMPVVACAHCQRSPAPDRLPVPGSLPRTDGAGRRPTTFQVPSCRECGLRARAMSTEQRGARLMAHLTGALVGLVFVVAALALNVIPFSSSLALGLALLAGIGFVGYAATAWIMLGRAGRLPRPPDAAYVRSTVRVVADPSAPLTAFEWRNGDFAASFHKANGNTAVAPPASIAESSPAA